jgi:hypothetical protein
MRRHLFDHGYPVATATLLAGSEVLLAVARQALRQSSAKLAGSFLSLANSSQRVMNSLARYGCSHAELAESRDNYVYLGPDRQPSEAAARHQPQHRPARAQPHHR